MNTLKFKTNINCGGCIAAVTPILNNIKEIEEWKVDTSIPEKVLEVKSTTIEGSQIIEALHKAGYKAEPFN